MPLDVTHEPGDIDWKKLSKEFQQILTPGPLEPKELHAQYHREFNKVCGAVEMGRMYFERSELLVLRPRKVQVVSFRDG